MDTGKFESFLKRLKSEGKKCLQVGKWFVRVYGELDNKPMVELESFQIVVKQNQKLEEENKKLKSDLEQFSEPYKKYRDYEKEELAESCYDLERENQKLKERIKKLEYLGDINEGLKEENKKLKERIKELEATNKKRTADNWATFKS